MCSVGDGKAASIPDALPATSSKWCPQEYFIFKRDMLSLFMCMYVSLQCAHIWLYMWMYVCACVCVEASRVHKSTRAGVKDSWKGCESHDPGAEN